MGRGAELVAGRLRQVVISLPHGNLTLKRKHSAPKGSGTVEVENCTVVEFEVAALDRCEQEDRSQFRDQRLASQKNHTWFRLPSVGSNLGKIEIIGQDCPTVLTGVLTDGGIGRIVQSGGGPMDGLVACLCQGIHPTGCPVHVNDQWHEGLAGQANFASLGQTGGKCQRLANVRLLKIGKIGQDSRESCVRQRWLRRSCRR